MFTHVDIDRYTVHVCSLFGLGTALNTTTSITRKGSFDKTYKQLLGVTNLYQIWMYEKCTYEQCMCIYVHIYNIIFIHMNNAYVKYVFNWIMCVYISIYIYIWEWKTKYTLFEQQRRAISKASINGWQSPLLTPEDWVFPMWALSSRFSNCVRCMSHAFLTDSGQLDENHRKWFLFSLKGQWHALPN